MVTGSDYFFLEPIESKAPKLWSQFSQPPVLGQASCHPRLVWGAGRRASVSSILSTIHHREFAWRTCRNTSSSMAILFLDSRRQVDSEQGWTASHQQFSCICHCCFLGRFLLLYSSWPRQRLPVEVTRLMTSPMPRIPTAPTTRAMVTW